MNKDDTINPRMHQSEPLKRCGFPSCQGACCIYGTWIDLLEVEDILHHAKIIAPHLPEGRQDPDGWFDSQKEPDDFTPSREVVHTIVLPNPDHYGGISCVFMREDFKCALQVAGEAAGEHRWRFKPFYCILHPLDMDEQGRITLDETELLVAEKASCLRTSKTKIPLTELFAEELEYLRKHRNGK